MTSKIEDGILISNRNAKTKIYKRKGKQLTAPYLRKITNATKKHLKKEENILVTTTL